MSWLVLLFVYNIDNIVGFELQSYKQNNGKPCFVNNVFIPVNIVSPSLYSKLNGCIYGETRNWKINGEWYQAKKYVSASIEHSDMIFQMYNNERNIHRLLEKSRIVRLPTFQCYHENPDDMSLLTKTWLGTSLTVFMKSDESTYSNLWLLLLSLQKTLSQMHQRNIYYVFWDPDDIRINLRQIPHIWIDNFALSQWINIETSNKFYRLKWIGVFKFWGAGFRTLLMNNLFKHPVNTTYARNLAIKGDKLSFAKITLYWLNGICLSNYDKKYKRICGLAYTLFGEGSSTHDSLEKIWDDIAEHWSSIISNISRTRRYYGDIAEMIKASNAADKIFFDAINVYICQLGNNNKYSEEEEILLMFIYDLVKDNQQISLEYCQHKKTLSACNPLRLINWLLS